MSKTKLPKIEGALARLAEARLPVEFDPQRHRLKIAAMDYGIEEARRIKDWPTLEEAVDAKIEEQHKFYAWWGASIRSQGEARKKENRGRGFLSVPEAEDLTGMKQQRVSDLGRRLDDLNNYRQRLLGAEYRAAMLEGADNVRGTMGTGEMEWFTPAHYVEKARRVLGGIDLDPASCIEAQKVIAADEFFTKADDGLAQKWHGRVWLNPPYAQPFIAQFASKMVREYRSGRVTAAIVLTNDCCDTVWFHELASAAALICFTRGRIKFFSPFGEKCAPLQGQVAFYFGPHLRDFRTEFADVGLILRRDDAAADQAPPRATREAEPPPALDDDGAIPGFLRRAAP